MLMGSVDVETCKHPAKEKYTDIMVVTWDAYCHIDEPNLGKRFYALVTEAVAKGVFPCASEHGHSFVPNQRVQQVVCYACGTKWDATPIGKRE